MSYALPVHHPFVHTVTQSREGRSRRLYCPSCLQPHNTRGRHALTRAQPPFFSHRDTSREKGRFYQAEPRYFSFRAHETGCTNAHANSTPSTSHRETFRARAVRLTHSTTQPWPHTTTRYGDGQPPFYVQTIKYLPYRLLVSVDRRTPYERSEQNYLPAAPRLCRDKHFSLPLIFILALLFVCCIITPLTRTIETPVLGLVNVIQNKRLLWIKSSSLNYHYN